MQDENTALQASALQTAERAKDLQAQLDKALADKGSLEAQLAVAASERRGTDEASRRTDQLLARFQQDQPALQARCEAAEDQNKELRLARDAMNEEMAQLKRDLAATTAEKTALAELARRAEDETGRLETTKSTLLERVENAEARGRELQHAKDAAFAERSRALQQLAVLTSEKNASDEQCTRLATQMREERGSLTVRCETAEAACREVTRDRDAIAEEKVRLSEQMAVMTVEKREAEARATQLEKSLQIAQEERSAMQVRCEGTEGRLRDIEALRDSTVSERQKVEQDVAVASSERRRVEEACNRAEASIKELQKDKQSLAARAEAAEARVKDVLAMRDAVVEERSRALEALATANAEKCPSPTPRLLPTPSPASPPSSRSFAPTYRASRRLLPLAPTLPLLARALQAAAVSVPPSGWRCWLAGMSPPAASRQVRETACMAAGVAARSSYAAASCRSAH